MSLHRVYRGTTATLAVQISTQPVIGWVLRLMEVSAQGETQLKTSADSSQILLNETTGAAQIFLTTEDTVAVRNISTVLRAQDGDEHHALSLDVIEVFA